MPPQIGIIASGPEQSLQAKLLAEKMGLPVYNPGRRYDFLLKCCPTGLELSRLQQSGLTVTIRIDFTSGQTAHRRRQQKREMLIRAVGIKQDQQLNIIDTTAGLGQDSFILATAGCRVLSFEKVPVIAALLEDGLTRARQHRETQEIAKSIQLVKEDALARLQDMKAIGKTTDVVYLDPMFPKRQKSALVKKELQILQMIADKDTQQEKLFQAALLAASQRVVVKRPAKSQPLTKLTPSHSIRGKTIRFDVYMIRANHT